MTSSTLREHVSELKLCGERRGTCFTVDLIRAKVLTVVEEVAAQVGADAFAVGAQELILLTCGSSSMGLCGGNRGCVSYHHAQFHQSTQKPTFIYLTTVELIRVVTTVINTIASLGHMQTDAVVEAAKHSGGRTLELP